MRLPLISRTLSSRVLFSAPPGLSPRAQSGARAPQSDPELRSFRRILSRRRERGSICFALAETAKLGGLPLFVFAPGDSCCWCCCRCCDLGLSLSFVVSSVSRARGRCRFISQTSLRRSLLPSSTPSHALPASVPAFPVALGYEYYILFSTTATETRHNTFFPGFIESYQVTGTKHCQCWIKFCSA